jgi:adenylosuccinate synthase
LGVAPQKIKEVIGVSKAYCTRVGGGPFPTELENETGEKLRKIGNEFGATTGRPRRCGWIDLVALNYACMLNGVTKLVITKADVLDSFEDLFICTGYKIGGKNVGEIPFQLNASSIEPQYEKLKGWKMESSTIKDASKLPKEMINYIQYINNKLSAKVQFISNGPGREQIIKLN